MSTTKIENKPLENQSEIEKSIESMVERIFSDHLISEKDFFSKEEEKSIESDICNIFSDTINNSNEIVTSLESMTYDLFNSKNEKSEEVYFGIDCTFSKEMINLITVLREEIKEILGANWKDENKRTILIKNELKNKDDIKGLSKILDDIGSCIARNCNIEKCYIGLFNDINAHTLPMIWDSSLLISDLKESVKKSDGFFFIKDKFVRTDKDIQSQLLKLEDITINKDGYKFKDSKGKVFLINVGLPLIVDNNYESSPEEICSIIFHEIGHNFQQILHGANQMLIDYYIKFNLLYLLDTKFFDIFKIMFDILSNMIIKYIIKSSNNNINYRFNIIKTMMFSNVLIDATTGEIITREKIGDIERNNLQSIIDKAKETDTLKTLSFSCKVLNIIGKTLIKTIKLIFIPITRAFNVIRFSSLNKKYSEVIKQNKSYEQFADTFAVSYGFGSYSSKFYIRIQNLMKQAKEIGASTSYLSILNYIPVLSKMELMNELLYRKMKLNLLGYDEDYVRIAQIYKALDYEIVNNNDLSSSQKSEIIKQIEIVKQDFEEFKQLEMGNIDKNKSLIAWLLKKARSGDIDSVASESGIVEGVLEVINEYEKTGVVKQPEIINDMKIDNVDKNKVDNIYKKVNNILKDGISFISQRLNVKIF